MRAFSNTTPARGVQMAVAFLAATLVQEVGWAQSSADHAAFVRVIEREVPAIMRAAKIKGVAIGLLVDGRLFYTRGFGFADHAGKTPVTPRTIFLAASLAKSIAGRVALGLADAGRIDLDRPIADDLPVWPLRASVFDHRLITMRRLLSHTAGTSLGGYQGWLDYAELPTLEQSLAGRTNGRGEVELKTQPGTAYEYSGGGYTLMQLAIERITGRPYVTLAQEQVFGPLQMAQSSVALTPGIAARAAQGHGDDGTPVAMRYYAEQAPSTLTTSVVDFARFMRAGMLNASGNRRLPLSLARLRESYVPVKATLDSVRRSDGHGLGVMVEKLADGSLAVGHDGRNQAGFRAIYAMRPERGDGIVILTNSRSGLAIDRVVCLWKTFVSQAGASGDSCRP